jgi:UDP:flavonoid glycosyltransferase YjiC (YdhE family)
MTHSVASAVGELDPIVKISRKLRVLMTHWDGSGNTPPQRALARELSRRGHDVHVLSHDTLAEAVIADGGRFHTLPSAPQWNPAQPRTNEEEGAFVVQNVVGSSDFAADFLAVRDAVRPDICLIDAMLISTLNVAIERRLPFAAINHIAWIREGACAGFLNSIIATLPGAAAGSTFFDLLERAPLVLATSYPEFGTQRKTASNIHFVGPIREPVARDPWPRRFPDRPFVLVSLSSMFQGQESTLRNICEAVSVLPIEVLVTTGRGIALDALSVSGDVDVRSFVPHDTVLPSADLVVTHAGLGTLMYSAGAGKPTLCLPNGRDQNDNAARVEALGLGRTLSPDAPPAAISSAVMDMLGDQALRAVSRSFASGVSRFGELTRAAELIERAVVAESLPQEGDMITSAVVEPTGSDVKLQYRCFQSDLQPEN